ncbi:membrane protein insertase YidC [Bacillus sp. FJAT-47783]|uniref:membrane protein insertase YidC n=1 Tax=Bacillus sp. FJAT-47783 TaxID=2922712 RepID=UPI001FAD516F|nr:membrane protein insertase YidC [Bacillus sp. FJAT-47783]
MKFVKNFSIFIMMFILTGCSMNGTDQNGGFFHTVLVEPFSFAIETIASIFHDNYGIAIIIITLMIRLLLMPMMLKQQKQQKIMKEKMDSIKPKMNEIQEKLKRAKDRAEQQQVQLEMMSLYKENGINPLSVGCLPLVIQMPILMGLYYAISSSNEIATHSFLWFDLGSPNIGLALMASAIYFVQTKISLQNIPNEQQQGPMKMMMFISPIMIGLFSLGAPAALPLYWAVGGLFLILQTLISQRLFSTKKQELVQPSVEK